MLFHYNAEVIPEWILPIKKFGWVGVDLFFVLSGYLIGLQLLQEMVQKKSISLRQFYFKRSIRILPAYFAVLMLYYLFPVLQEGNGLPAFWKFITFTQNIALDVETSNTFSHAWSLCIEEQFYLILPLTILLVYALKITSYAYGLLIVLFVMGFIIRYYSWHVYVAPLVETDQPYRYDFLSHLYYPTYCRLDGLLIGFSIAAFIVFKPVLANRVMKHGNIILISGLMLLMVAYFVCNKFIAFGTALYGYTLVSVAAGFLVLAATSPTCALHTLKSRVSFVVATLSYSLYLIHKQMYHVTKMIFNTWDVKMSGGQLMIGCVVMAVIAGLALHLIIERPMLFLRDRLLTSNSK